MNSDPIIQVFLTEDEAIVNAWSFSELYHAGELIKDGSRFGTFEGRTIVVKPSWELEGNG